MHKSSQSISSTLLAVNVSGFICATAPVPHGDCTQGKAVLGFIRSICAAILHQICTAGSPSWSWCSYSREVSSLQPCVRHQLYLKRTELDGDGGWSGVALDSMSRLCLCPEWELLSFPVWSSYLLQNTVKSVHKETHPKIQN